MKATQIVHWPGQDTPCCDNHAQALKNVGAIIGCVISATVCMTDTDCTNCKNDEAFPDEALPMEAGK